MLTYEHAVQELFYSLHGANPTNYHSLLYRLIGQADAQNKALLRLAYPMEVLAWDDWQQSDDKNDFFIRFGFKAAFDQY